MEGPYPVRSRLAVFAYISRSQSLGHGAGHCARGIAIPAVLPSLLRRLPCACHALWRKTPSVPAALLRFSISEGQPPLGLRTGKLHSGFLASASSLCCSTPRTLSIMPRPKSASSPSPRSCRCWALVSVRGLPPSRPPRSRNLYRPRARALDAFIERNRADATDNMRTFQHIAYGEHFSPMNTANGAVSRWRPSGLCVSPHQPNRAKSSQKS
jgi:hypothetical protein